MDIFCPVVDPDWFFALSTKFTEGNPLGPRLFDVDGFLTVDQVVKYKEVIIALGNSNHNCYVFALLKKVAEHGSLSRVTLYVHDPCLLNVLQIGLELSSSDMLSLMEQTYRRRVPVSIEEREDRGALQKALIKCGMLGNRYFLNAGITRYLVNSDAAATLLESDLHGGNVTIMRIFHPVFLPIENDVESPQASREEPKRIVVGTFGVPNQGKQTSLIAGAVRRLRERGADACLMIAGFQASLFVSAHRDLLADVEVEVYDGPTDRQLVNCMAKCDVAVQLRSTNLGESSGMVPQLLVLGKDVIVTGIGAFIEYGPCVKYVPTDVTEEALADAILDSLSAPIETSLKQAYVSQHSPERFQDAFCELFALPRSHTPERFVSVR
jgi:glycosyltransferase involved in cell wall biosynthesis